MKAWIPLTLVFALGLAAHAQATCSYPQSPAAPPDGNTATRDEMVAASTDFDRYNGEDECLIWTASIWKWMPRPRILRR